MTDRAAPMQNPAARLIHRTGRRGAVLLILALIDLAYGLSLIGPSADDLKTSTAQWLRQLAPLWVWGAAWLVVGVILIVSAFRQDDSIGYVAAIGIKVMWALTTFSSWAFGEVERGWVGSIVWLTFASLVVIISGWPEPVDPPPTDESDA